MVSQIDPEFCMKTEVSQMIILSGAIACHICCKLVFNLEGLR